MRLSANQIALVERRKLLDLAFFVLGAMLAVLCLGVLVALVGDLVRDALPRLGLDFFNSFPSRKAAQAGVKSAFVGTILVMCVTAVTAIPLGIAAGVYLEEYARKNWLTNLIEINIANLAGVPSIIWGLMALGLMVYQFGMGRSVGTAGVTLGLLVLPIVIVSTREAVRSIPQVIREGSFACGATRLQTVRHHILPYSLPGVLTGCIIAMSRAIGETAPLITIGALTYVAYLPPYPGQRIVLLDGTTHVAGPMEWFSSGYTVMPIQMYDWISRPQTSFHANAAAAGVVLVIMTLSMNAVAIILRNCLRRRIQW